MTLGRTDRRRFRSEPIDVAGVESCATDRSVATAASAPSRARPSQSRHTCQPAPSRAALPSVPNVSMNVSTVPTPAGAKLEAQACLRPTRTPDPRRVDDDDLPSNPGTGRPETRTATRARRTFAEVISVGKPLGQLRRCSVSARHTFSGGCGRVRVEAGLATGRRLVRVVLRLPRCPPQSSIASRCFSSSSRLAFHIARYGASHSSIECSGSARTR